MILERAMPWGVIVGKLSLTPEQAERMLGFKMKQGAKGVVIYQRGGKTIVRNLMPYRKTLSKRLKKHRKFFNLFMKIGAKHLEDLIYPVWEPLTKNKTYHGFHMFVGENVRNIGTPHKWEKMIISKGEIPPPVILKADFNKNELQLSIESKLKKTMLGIAILNTKTGCLHHILPKYYRKLENIKVKVNTRKISYPVVSVYFKLNNKYSNSTSLIPDKNGGKDG